MGKNRSKITKKVIAFITATTLMISLFTSTSLGVNHAYASTQATYYVSPSGSDSNDGTISQPFSTLAKARDTVRTINGSMTGDIIVYLRGGTYSLTNTLLLDQTDSGTNGYNVIYKAYNGETPIISGGTPVTGWTLSDAAKNIYVANVGTSFNARQFYVDGVRVPRARSVGALTGFTKTGTGFTLPATGLYSTMATWRNPQDIEFSHQNGPNGTRTPVESITGLNVTMKSPAWSNTHNHFTPNSNPTYIDNAYELLDTAGEWYLSRSEGKIYYIPRAGESMTTSTFIAASLETLVSGIGTLDNPIHNIQFDGLTFSYDTWFGAASNDGYADLQTGVLKRGPNSWDKATWVVPAGVTFSTAKNFVIQNCNFTHMGSVGLNFDYGSQNNLIDHNNFSDISGNGMNIGGVSTDIDHHPTDPRVYVKDNKISNNTMTRVGAEYLANAAIFIGYTQGTLITHNTLYDLPYTGISMGFGWGFADTYGTSQAKDNIISSNLIYNIMNKLHDGGAIYTLGNQPGSKVYNNYLYADLADYGYLYRDNGSSGFIDTNNVISNAVPGTNRWYYTNSVNSPAYYNAHDNIAYLNYYSDGMVTFKTGGTNAVKANFAVVGNAWNSNALSIMDNAGVDGGDGPAPNFDFKDNLALGKTATQSSTKGSSTANIAVDGNTDGNGTLNQISQTNSDSPAWWMVDLGGLYSVGAINVYNRTDANKAGLSDYKISVLDANQNVVWSNNQTTYPDPKTSVDAMGANGKYVKIQLNNPGSLALAEVEVFTGSNLAYNKAATQSSTFSGSGANLAVDGIVDGNNATFPISHTNSEAQAWWMVDLGADYSIGDINVFNRTDAVPERLNDYNIIVLDASQNAVWTNHQTSYPNPQTTVNAAGTKGRYVKIQLTGTNYLGLAEVQVFAFNPLQPSITAPNITVDSNGATMVPVNYNPTAKDVNGNPVQVFCSPVSGSSFPLGTTTVNCSATDAAGNRVIGNFTVTVTGNLAYHKAATQSSTLSGQGANLAVDGIVDGNNAKFKVSHTNIQAQAWWMVDLGADYSVGVINVFNRTDAVPERLNDYNIIVLNASQNAVWTNHQTSYPNPQTTVNAAGTKGRYVKIQLTGTNYLSLAEVQVFAYKPPADATFTADITVPTNSDVSVTILYPDVAQVREYKLDADGAWNLYTAPIVMTMNRIVYARSKDAVGNISNETNYAVSNIDKVAPQDATLSANITVPTNNDVKVTIGFPADATIKEYKLGTSGTWTAYGGPVVVSENGTVYARGTDAAGNVSNEISYTISNIDRIAPIDATLAVDKTTPTNQSVTVMISYPADASLMEYKVGASGAWTAYTEPVDVSDNDTVYARGTDAVGNVSNVSSITVSNIYKIAPVTTATLSPAAPNGRNSWYTTDVTASLSVSASVYGGTVTTEYKVNKGEWIVYTGSIPAFGDGTYVFGYRSKDQAGNVEDLKTVEFQVDKTAPTLSVQLDKTSIWPANHEMVTINATLDSSDATSGVESVVLTSITSNQPDSGKGDIQADFGTAATSFSLRAEKSRIYTITYTATDKAGNKTVKTVTVTVPHDQSGNH